MSELNNQEKGDIKRILVYGMTSNRGGIEAYLMNYFRILAGKGVIFDFVTDYKEIAYKEEIEKLGGKVYYIPNRREGILKHMKSLRNILLEHKEYRSIYFNILSASEVFTVLSAVGVKGVKRIVHSHNNSVKTIGRHKVLRPLLAKLADVKLACSDEAAEFMFGSKSFERHESEIIFNAINVEKYQYDLKIRNEVRENLKLTENTFVVGHVGRMCHQKNSLFLLEIFNHIYKKNNNAVLLYAGDGEEREKVENAIEHYGIKENVLLLGMRNDVNELMQAMDVFLLPSRFEGLPVVLVEAQAAGLQCICSDRFTKKSDITGNVQFISLDKDVDYWARVVMDRCEIERKDTTDMITKAGFNIVHEVDKLEKILKGI